MLKLFYKTLLVSVLSGSLLLLDFSYKGIALQVVQAETVKTEKINDKDLMGTLTMTVVGTLASRMYQYKMTTDVMLAAAGGAIFLAGEVLAFFKLKEVMKGMEQEITRDKNGNINREQIAALERLKKSYEEAKKTANTKKTLQMAAAAAFAAAAVAAYTLQATDLTALTTCTTGITTATAAVTAVDTATCDPLLEVVYTAALGAQCKAEVVSCKAAIKAYSASMKSYEMARQATGPSSSGLATVTGMGTALTAEITALSGTCLSYTSAAQGALAAACKPLVPTNSKGTSGGTALRQPGDGGWINKLPPALKKNFIDSNYDGEMNKLISQNKESTFNSYLTKAFNLIFPTANAELFSAMGIASSLAIKYILATTATIGPAIDNFMLIPQKRAIVWGILSGLTFAATTATNNVIAQIEANIKKIDAILNSYKAMADGTTATQTTVGATPAQMTLKPAINTAANAVDYEAIDLSNYPNGTLPCSTVEQNGKCKSMEDAVKELPSFDGLDADSQLQLSSILKTANGLSGTSSITKGTLNGAAKLAGQYNAINGALNRNKTKSAEGLKKAGINYNGDAEAKKLSDSIEKAMLNELKKNNSNANDMYASMYGGKAGSASTTGNDDAAKKAAAAAEAEALAAALARAKGSNAGGAIDINAGSAEKMDLGLTGVDNGSNGKMSAEELAAYNQAAKAAAGSMDEYDIKNDISKDSGANIFELISNRYQQSGYPRLFKVKEAATPASTPAVKN